MKALVTLVNPNKVQPGITPYALDILGTSLEQDGFDVEVVDLTFRQSWKSVVREYFSQRNPLLCGITIRNTDTIYPQEQRNFLDDHLEIINQIKLCTKAPLVAGGAGFSSMPHCLLEYFDVPYGVKGPGEVVLCNLANALYNNESPHTVPGLLVYDGYTVRKVPNGHAFADGGQNKSMVNCNTLYIRRSGTPLKVDNLEYYKKGGLGNILFKNGCALACAHCVEPDAKGSHFSKRSPAVVVDELELLARQGVCDIHTSDSEANLGIEHTKKILREIIARKKGTSPLHKVRLWFYSQPAPFDREFAELLSQAGCKGVNVSVEHTNEEILKSWKVTKNGNLFYTFEDVKRIDQLIKENNMLNIYDVMIGMPGETIETVYQCIDDILGLDPTVVGFALGIRVFPYSALGIRFANESDGTKIIPGLQSNTAVSPIVLKPLHKCESAADYERQFMFDEYNRQRPLYYFSPDLPEDPETIASPNGRWVKTLQLMWEYIPEELHHKVMLPTIPGCTKDDNNFADNPFLLCLVKLGYKGAYWSRWGERDKIIQEAVDKGLANIQQYKRLTFASDA